MARTAAAAAPSPPSPRSAVAAAAHKGMSCFAGNAILLAVLGLCFFLLSPGVITTIPTNTTGSWFFNQKTSYAAAAVHTIVFVIVVGLLLCSPPMRNAMNKMRATQAA